MADPKDLNEKQLSEAMVNAAVAGDMARAAGLELSAEIAEIRAEQAAIEAARLRFVRGKDAPEAALPIEAAKARADRREAAAAIAAEVRAALEKSAKRPERRSGEARDPSQGGIIENPGGAIIREGRDDEPDRAGAFELTGRIVGIEDASGLKVELRTLSPVRAFATEQPMPNGDFTVRLVDVAEIKRKLDLTQNQALEATIVVRSGNKIVARDDRPIRVNAGGRAVVSLEIARE